MKQHLSLLVCLILQLLIPLAVALGGFGFDHPGWLWLDFDDLIVAGGIYAIAFIAGIILAFRKHLPIAAIAQVVALALYAAVIFGG